MFVDMEKESLLGKSSAKKDDKYGRKSYTFAAVVAGIIFLGVVSLVYGFKQRNEKVIINGAADDNDDANSCPYNNYTIGTCNKLDYPVLEGADVVAYFVEGATSATIGSSTHSSTYRGYLFYFESETNKAIFDSDPHQYAPKYGGFCAFGLTGEDPRNDVQYQSQLSTVPSNLDSFSIVDGRLYMFRGSGAKDLFIADFDELSADSDELWTSWFGEDCDGYYDTNCFKS
jgi:YHS domain-containing protein